MTLSRHSINKLFEAHGWHYFASKPDMFIPVARAIESETRKADTKLIRQMLDVLESQCGQRDPEEIAAITAAKTRLGE